MALETFTLDPVVKRLRWVVAGNILFNVAITLACQPGTFWSHPETAIRGDGLSIANPTNFTFQFFLGHGWQPYLAASLAWILLVFALVSLLPRLAALTAAFSFLFGYAFSNTNWIVVEWHQGYLGVTIYGAILGAAIVSAALLTPHAAHAARLRLRWIAVLTMSADFVITLAGQPHRYWLHPHTVHEANAVSRFFLERGWAAFVGYDVFYIAAIFWLATVLPEIGGAIWAFGWVFAGFVGISCWCFYEWRMGMQTPVLFGCILSALIVLAVFTRAPSPVRKGSDHPEPENLRTLWGCCKAS
ncbi:MAG TPA: hypothetical protein VGG45_02760 [Terracidiphilus sp.]|jgi:hypothetical protein